MDDIAVHIDHVSKNFVLPHEKITTIKSAFTSLYRFPKRRTRETQHALKDIAFDVKKGEFFGIVGRNGSGKSTLLKILAGIYQPTSGSVAVNGRLVPFIELGVGFNPELTGRENVYLNGAMMGFSRKEVTSMYDDVVAFAELERFMDQKLKNYSSGMQVRLAFSMATRAQADILLVDEVLAVGDADFQRKCFQYFRELKKDRKTVVFVSHDMEAIREYCDRAVLIEDSTMRLIGKVADVTREYSKLFMTADAASIQSNGKDRWGDGLVATQKIEATIEPETITITQRVRAAGHAEGYIAGFRIRDGAGREVTGTNTKIEQAKMPELRLGASVVLTWTLPNILSDGRYSIDPAILHADGITVADWWDGALQFTVRKMRHLPYAIDPFFELTLGKVTGHD